MTSLFLPADPGSCSVLRCHARARARGMCMEHYWQQAHGRPFELIDRAGPPVVEPIPEWMREEATLERMLAVTDADGEET